MRNQQSQRYPPMYSNPKVMGMATLFLASVVSIMKITTESEQIHHAIQVEEWADGHRQSIMTASATVGTGTSESNRIRIRKEQALQPTPASFAENEFTLAPGELPGYTGWARPEQTLAGYFDIQSLSHPPTSSGGEHTKYHSIVNSGDKFSLLLTCNHNRTSTTSSGSQLEPPYECPSTGGTLFYIRAYGPSVITGLVSDHSNASYSLEMQFVDPGVYTLEAVVTFSVPLEFDELPIDTETDDEPGYEGYTVYGFPLLIRVNPVAKMALSPSSDTKEQDGKPWCTLAQLTESSSQSALYKGHWQIIDHVSRSSHQPLTPDETLVSLDGYRMGLNSVGVRMQYEYEDCELIHIRDIVGGMSAGVMDKCLERQFGIDIRLHDGNTSLPDISDNTADPSNDSSINANATIAGANDVNRFEGVHVIFIGDSVMRLVKFFFLKLVRGSFGIKVTFIETNGGIHATMHSITSALEDIQQKEKGANVKRVIMFNSGLHDIDILCSSKRASSRNKTNVLSNGESCSDAYRDAMGHLMEILDEFPADLKVFRSTTAGWHKYGNYGFSWRANHMQPMSRSPHLAHHFNTIVIDIIQKQYSNILIADGYWLTLPRPDHTQTSSQNEVGKHMVHPGFEVLSVFARRWFMLILRKLWGDSFEDYISCIGGGSEEDAVG